MTWYFNFKPFEPTQEQLKTLAGFVYCITHIKTGKKYIGRKVFWFHRKGKGLRRKRIESDWRTYFGSSKSLLNDVARYGANQFRRDILSTHKTVGSLNYTELEEQIMRKVLERDDYYNDCVAKYRNINRKGMEITL